MLATAEEKGFPHWRGKARWSTYLAKIALRLVAKRVSTSPPLVLTGDVETLANVLDDDATEAQADAVSAEAPTVAAHAPPPKFGRALAVLVREYIDRIARDWDALLSDRAALVSWVRGHADDFRMKIARASGRDARRLALGDEFDAALARWIELNVHTGERGEWVEGGQHRPARRRGRKPETETAHRVARGHAWHMERFQTGQALAREALRLSGVDSKELEKRGTAARVAKVKAKRDLMQRLRKDREAWEWLSHLAEESQGARKNHKKPIT